MNPNKEAVRQELWEKCHALWPQKAQEGRPPQFSGMGKAAERLRRTREYQSAHNIVVLPDPVLLQVRINALIDNKILICATPGLKQGLVRIEPKDIPVALRRPSLGGHALAANGKRLTFPRSRLGKVGLMVVPALAVDKRGFVLGDGRGLTDLAYALLRMLGAVQDHTPVAAIADQEQRVELVPTDPWDLAVDMLVTPQGLERFEAQRPRPGLAGLPDKLAKLPVVQGIRQGAGKK